MTDQTAGALLRRFFAQSVDFLEELAQKSRLSVHPA